MKVKELIKELENLSEDKKDLPVVVVCPNGLEVYPKIKLGFPNIPGTDYGDLDGKPNRIVIVC